jgi:hypothetical protein
MIRSKYDNCPACEISVAGILGANSVKMRAVSKISMGGADLPDVLGFYFTCGYCYYEWFEEKRKYGQETQTQKEASQS